MSPLQRFLKCSCIKYSFTDFLLQACIPQCTEKTRRLYLLYLSVLFCFFFLRVPSFHAHWVANSVNVLLDIRVGKNLLAVVFKSELAKCNPRDKYGQQCSRDTCSCFIVSIQTYLCGNLPSYSETGNCGLCKLYLCIKGDGGPFCLLSAL